MGFLRKFRKGIWKMEEKNVFALLQEEISLARDEYEHAFENFRHASPEYIDAAIARLNAAEIYLNMLWKELRQHYFKPFPAAETLPEETVREADEPLN